MNKICKTNHNLAIEMLTEMISDCQMRRRVAMDNVTVLIKWLHEQEQESWKRLRKELLKEGLISEEDVKSIISYRDKTIFLCEED